MIQEAETVIRHFVRTLAEHQAGTDQRAIDRWRGMMSGAAAMAAALGVPRLAIEEWITDEVRRIQAASVVGIDGKPAVRRETH